MVGWPWLVVQYKYVKSYKTLASKLVWQSEQPTRKPASFAISSATQPQVSLWLCLPFHPPHLVTNLSYPWLSGRNLHQRFSTGIVVPLGHMLHPALGGSHGDLLKVKQWLFPYLRVVLPLCQLVSIVPCVAFMLIGKDCALSSSIHLWLYLQLLYPLLLAWLHKLDHSTAACLIPWPKCDRLLNPNSKTYRYSHW